MCVSTYYEKEYLSTKAAGTTSRLSSINGSYLGFDARLVCLVVRSPDATSTMSGPYRVELSDVGGLIQEAIKALGERGLLIQVGIPLLIEK